MNIYVVAKNPQTAAHMLCDRHVYKQPFDMVRILCAVTRQYLPHFLISPTDPHIVGEPVERQLQKWAACSTVNYAWLVLHTAELFEEHLRRFGKPHASALLFERVRITPYGLPSAGVMPFARALPLEYNEPNVVDAYRRFYIERIIPQKWCFWKRGSPAPYWAEEAYNKALDYRR